MDSPNTPNQEFDEEHNASEAEKILLEQMNSEYKILQDKIDKIGGFRTTIRGWSVTLVVASIIAAGSSKTASPYFLALLFLFIYAFDAMERKQNRNGDVFGARVLQLEKRMRQEMRPHLQNNTILGFYPGIAHHIRSHAKRRPSGRLPAWMNDPDRFFYIAQALSVAIAMAVLFWLGPNSKPDIETIIQTESAPHDIRVEDHASLPRPTNAETRKTGLEKKNAQSKGR